MKLDHPLCQQNGNFYGKTVFTLSFNETPIKFVTLIDAETKIAQIYKKVQEMKKVLQEQRKDTTGLGLCLSLIRDLEREIMLRKQ